MVHRCQLIDISAIAEAGLAAIDELAFHKRDFEGLIQTGILRNGATQKQKQQQLLAIYAVFLLFLLRLAILRQI